MSETGNIAKIIACEYEKLGEAFGLSKDRARQILLDLNNDRCLIIAKREDLQARQNLAATSLREPILTACISSLHDGLCSLEKLNTALMKMKSFWGTAAHHSEDLTDPNLADLAYLNQMAAMGASKFREFRASLEQEAKAINLKEKEMGINLVIPNPLNEKKKPMKTGRDITIPYTPIDKMFNELKSGTFSKIEEAFDDSYFSWLALAKINQVMVDAIRRATTQVEMMQNDILYMEKDPLTIMLHEDASH